MGEIRQWDETVLVAFSSADMNQFPLTVDIAHLQVQGLGEAQAHGIGYQKKDPVAQLACRTDQLFDFAHSENIGQWNYFRRLHYIHPPPVLFEDMFPEKLQTIAVNLDRTPGMGLHQFGKVELSLFQAQLIGAAIKVLTDPTHSPSVCIDGLFTFALQLEQTKMTLIKLIKSIHFSFIHGILPLFKWCPELGSQGRIYSILVFFPPRERLRPTRG